MMSGKHRYPFTASQWQELEHQALIFKYMVAGIPVPAHLLYALQTSCCLDPSLSPSSLFSTPPQQHMIGWNSFHMGLGRKVDPEPGRCRRTDGKKWRCSKEAHPDSKYCERHMHRGKNRSRKPVEFPLTPITNTNNTSHYESSNIHGDYGMKEEQPCGSMRRFCGSSMEDSWQLSVGASGSGSSSSSSRLRNQKEYCCLKLQSLTSDEAPKERTVHRFFDEGPPPENQEHPWKPLEEDRSTTKLSISIPSSLDFPIYSRTHHDG